MRVLGLIAGLALALVSVVSAAQDVQTPQLSFASVDWPGAIAALPITDPPPVAPMSAKSRLGANRAAAPALARINSIMSQQFAGIATSPVPVLVPFDVAALLRDRDAGAEPDVEQYYSGFHAARFFYPGPAGYDAAFAIRTGDIPELADSKFADPIEVQISGSAVLYDLAAPIVVEGQPVPALDEEFPGIRKMNLEHYLRYTFVRYGVPYVVSIACFDASASRYKMPTCRSADQVGQRFLRALRVAGGMPRNLRPARPLPVERPERVSNSFGYYGPGQIVVRHRLPQPARPGRLHGLFADPLSARGCARLCQLRSVSASRAPRTQTTPAPRCGRGAIISASAAASRSASAPPASATRARTSPRTVQAAARDGALHPPRATSSRCATV